MPSPDEPPRHHHDDELPIVRLIVGVAVIVALVILVFFGLGYALGRAYL